MCTQLYSVHWTQEHDQEEGLHEDYFMHCYVERYKIISNPMNIQMNLQSLILKSKNSDLKIKKHKNLKT